MSNYQRLISYIYTYEGGIRGKNIGFAKLETRGSQCRITVNVKKIFVGGNPVGVYLLSGQDEVKIGTLFARNGAGEFRTMVNSADVENSGHSLEEFYGLSVHDVESAWRSYTTIWEDAVAHAAEVELADVTSEKVAMKHDNTAKVQSALQTEEKEQELLPISREIEEQVEKEAVLQEESVCEATDRKQAETGSRVYDAEQGKIVHLSSEIPKVSRNTAQTAEGRAFTSGLREKIVSQIRQNEAAVPDEKAWRDPALPDAADAEAVKKEEVNADETNRDGIMAPEVNPAEFSSSEVSSSEVNSTEVNSWEADLPEAEPEELKPAAEIIRGADIQEADKTEGGTGIFAQSAAQETLPIRQSAVETVKRRMPVWRMPEPEPVNGSDPVTEEPLQEMEIPKAETALPQQEEAGEDEAIQGLDSTVTSEVEYIAPGLAKTNRQPEFQPNNAAPGMSGPAVHSSGMMLQESSGRQQPEQLRQGQMPTTQRAQNQMQPGQIRQSQMQPAQGQAVQPQIRQEQMQAMQQMLWGQMQSAQMRQNQLRQGQMQQSRSQQSQTQQSQTQQNQARQSQTQPGQMQQQNPMNQSQVQQPQMQAAQMKMSQDRGGGVSQRYGTPRRGMQSGALRNETLKPESLGPAQEEQTDDRKETQPDMCETSPPSGVTAPFKDLSDICDEQEVWEMMRKKYPKILAFDYADGCEVLTIKPQDIGLLPREEWVYGSNSFLLHGYYNYRYLILARLNNPEGKARYLLGVPGHYLSNEKYMASMFGFSNFVLAKKQPPRDSRFGYWYTDVKIGD